MNKTLLFKTTHSLFHSHLGVAGCGCKPIRGVNRKLSVKPEFWHILTSASSPLDTLSAKDVPFSQAQKVFWGEKISRKLRNTFIAKNSLKVEWCGIRFYTEIKPMKVKYEGQNRRCGKGRCHFCFHSSTAKTCFNLVVSPNVIAKALNIM